MVIEDKGWENLDGRVRNWDKNQSWSKRTLVGSARRGLGRQPESGAHHGPGVLQGFRRSQDTLPQKVFCFVF